MSPVQNVWRQLVQRRLWPVAILLIAGLAVVPLTLAKDPETVPAPPATPAQTEDNDLAKEPIVTMASVEQRSNRRRVLGSRKNPFAMAKKQKATKTTDKASDSVVTKTKSADDPSDGSSGSGSGSGSSGGGTTTSPSPSPAPTTPAEPAPKPKTYAPQELSIRFGGSEDGGGRQSLKRLQALPSEAEPVLIYMGLVGGGKVAEFMVGDGVVPVGDGECRPSPEECETVRLRAGETEFFDIQDETGNVSEQFQLDLLKIHRSGGASASRAKASVKAAVRLARSGAGLRSTIGQSTARLP